MTICVGALAAGGKSIVCVADKAITYAGYIQWDADSTKIIAFGGSPNVLALIAGTEEPIERVCRKLTLEHLDQALNHHLDLLLNWQPVHTV